jgi:hypothetical protein
VPRELDLAFSAANQSSIDVLQDPVSQALGSARPVADLQVNSRVARAPNTLRAQVPAVIQREAARALPGHDRDSEHVQALELLVRALAHAQALVAHRRLAKPRVRSVLRRAAVAVASSSTPRPKKAQ